MSLPLRLRDIPVREERPTDASRQAPNQQQAQDIEQSVSQEAQQQPSHRNGATTDEEFVPVLSTTEDKGEYSEGLLGTDYNSRHGGQSTSRNFPAAAENRPFEYQERGADEEGGSSPPE